MTSKYFAILVALISCSAKSMEIQNYSKKIEDLGTSITFQDQTKTMYQFMLYDRDKSFGYTPLYRCKEKDADDNTRFVKIGTIKTLNEEKMINAIALGWCYYYDGLKIKTIENNKIEIGAIVDFHRKPTEKEPIDYPLFRLELQRLWLTDKMFGKHGTKKIQRLNAVSVAPTTADSTATTSNTTTSTVATLTPLQEEALAKIDQLPNSSTTTQLDIKK